VPGERPDHYGNCGSRLSRNVAALLARPARSQEASRRGAVGREPWSRRLCWHRKLTNRQEKAEEAEGGSLNLTKDWSALADDFRTLVLTFSLPDLAFFQMAEA
jgi:hypothetical protein